MATWRCGMRVRGCPPASRSRCCLGPPAGDDYLLYIFFWDAAGFQKNLDAAADGGLGQLQLSDIALVDGNSRLALAFLLADQDKLALSALLADTGVFSFLPSGAMPAYLLFCVLYVPCVQPD